VRCTQRDFLLYVKRWMLKFELTHNCMDCMFPGFMYILRLVMSLTMEEV